MSSANQQNKRFLRNVISFGLLGAVAAGFTWACVSSSSDNKGAGGSAGNVGGGTGAGGGNAGGSTGSSINTGGVTSAAGGATGAGGTGNDPCATTAAKPCTTTPTACTPVAPTNALVTDWVDVCHSSATATCADGMFVDNDTYSTPAQNWWTLFFGGPYVYPFNPQCSTIALTQTISAHSWHITGTIGNAAIEYSGFGLWFSPCMANFSAYGGISFTISGTLGTAGSLTVVARSSSNTVHDPTSCATNVKTCTLTADGGGCTTASTTLAVPATPTLVTLRWTDFTNGAPDLHPNPAEIWGIEFTPPAPYMFPWNNDAGKVVPTLTGAYPLDITIGDITLVP